MDDLISVIIPVYNVEQYLDRCLQSVVNQTYKNLEIILVDDGSTDSSGKICDDWKKKDDRIYVVHKSNGGLSSARNAGMKKMTGKYVAFIDSDDWIELNMYEELINLLKENPNCEVAQGDFYSSKNENVVKQPSVKIEIWNKQKMFKYFFRVDGEKSNTGVWNKVIKVEILQGFSFVDTLNEDVEASYELFHRANNMVVSNQIYYRYNTSSVSITRSMFKKKDLDYLLVWDRIVERTALEYPQFKEYALMGRKRADFTMLSKMFIRGYDKNNQEMCDAKRRFKNSLKNNFFSLVKWKMPLNRKLLLVYLVFLF